MNEVSQAVFLTMAQNAGSGPSGVYSMFVPSGIAAVYGVGIILVFLFLCFLAKELFYLTINLINYYLEKRNKHDDNRMG